MVEELTIDSIKEEVNRLKGEVTKQIITLDTLLSKVQKIKFVGDDEVASPKKSVLLVRIIEYVLELAEGEGGGAFACCIKLLVFIMGNTGFRSVWTS